MKVKLNLYINVNDINEDTAIDKAVKMVGALDTINEDTVGEELVTKLYYIVPKLGKIFVVVNDADKKTLGVESNVLANTNISDYPIEKLPSQMVAYKELIIKKGSSLSSDDISSAAIAMINDMPSDLISVVKIINYNDDYPSQLVMPIIYGDHIFKSVSGIDNYAKNTILDGWSLLHQFASQDGVPAYPDMKTIEGKTENIHTKQGLDEAGISYYLTSVNDSSYHIEKHYMKAYYSSHPEGYIEIPLPDGYSNVKVEWGNWYGDIADLYVGGEKVQHLEARHGAATYEGPYEPGDTLKMVEHGIFWVKAIWVK